MNYHKIISGEQQTIGAAIARAGLTVLEAIYFPAITIRNLWYDVVPGAVHSVDVPVISIGNVTMGGTGKTPLTAAVVKYILNRAGRPAVISRGYKAKPGELNDEGKELQTRNPDGIYVQNPNRVLAAKTLCSQDESSRPRAIILDDGFQHRRLARNLDVVLIDALNPFGYDRICPRGTLRESLRSLRRADCVIITHADGVSEQRLQDIEQRVLAYNPGIAVSRACHRPGALRLITGETVALESINGKRVLAFCGLGNPDAFRQTVNSLGCVCEQFNVYPDHYQYTNTDQNDIISLARESKVDAIVCTMKDYVKLSDAMTRSPVPVYGIEINMEFLTGEKEFWALIDNVLSPDDGYCLPKK